MAEMCDVLEVSKHQRHSRIGRAAKKQSFIPADPDGPPLTFAESVLKNVSIHNEKDLKLAYDRSHYPKKQQKTDYCLPE